MQRALRASLAVVSVVFLAAARSAMAQASDSVRSRWLLLPGFGWEQETGWQIGVTAINSVTRDSTTWPRTTGAYLVRTQKGQTRFALERDAWAKGNRRRVQTSMNAVEYPFSFYGIGDSTTALQRERYTPRWIEALVQVDDRRLKHFYGVYALRVGFQEVVPKDSGLIQNQLVPGSRFTRTVIATVGVTYDTRDHAVSTRRGQRMSLAYSRSEPLLGATYPFGRVDFDWRGFREFRGRHVLAANANIVGVDGTIPFDRYAFVGGNRIMRGYPAGRFRDRWVGAVQAEYRSPTVMDRLGAVAFAGVGAAAQRPGLLGSGRPFPSFGIGGRLQTDSVQRSSLRCDYAFAAYGFGGLFLGFNQAF